MHDRLNFQSTYSETICRDFVLPRYVDGAEIANSRGLSIVLTRETGSKITDSLSVIPWISSDDWHFNYSSVANPTKSHSFRLPWHELGRHVDFGDFYTDDEIKSTSSFNSGKIPHSQTRTDLECFLRLTSYGRFRDHSKFY